MASDPKFPGQITHSGVVLCLVVRHHVRMDRDWKRLGDATRRARKSLGLNQDELAEAAGVSRATVQAIEQGVGFADVPKSVHKVAAAVGWPPGHAERILAGEDPPAPDAPEQAPTSAPASAPDPRDVFTKGMPRGVIHELTDTEGEILGSIVTELSRATPNTKLMLLLKRDDSAGADEDPEEVKRSLREWSRIQRALLQLTTDDRDSSESPDD